jgi:hypothetical protein
VRLTIGLSTAAVVGGLILALVFDSLLGAILIIGGIAGLGVAMTPEILARFTQFLSTGTIRRNRW